MWRTRWRQSKMTVRNIFDLLKWWALTRWVQTPSVQESSNQLPLSSSRKAAFISAFCWASLMAAMANVGSGKRIKTLDGKWQDSGLLRRETICDGEKKWKQKSTEIRNKKWLLERETKKRKEVSGKKLKTKQGKNATSHQNIEKAHD